MAITITATGASPITTTARSIAIRTTVYCDPNDWWNCNYWQNNCNDWSNNCKCKNVWPNSCGKKFNWPNSCGKKPVCPVPTGNYWNYCIKHPKCCGWK